MLRRRTGQTLLEVVVLVGVIVVIGSGLVFVTINSVRNTQFSKSQVQATKYAQEGIDIVRSLRDRNGYVCVSTINPSTWSSFWSSNLCTDEIAPAPSPIPTPSPTTNINCFFVIKNSTPGANCTPASSTAQLWLDTGSPTTFETLAGGFNRQVAIQYLNVSTKKILVTVSWTDSSGQHSSQLVTYLTNY